MQLKSVLLKAKSNPGLIIFLLTALLTIITPLMSTSATLGLFVLFLATLILPLFLLKNKLKTETIIAILFALGLILRLAYVLYTGVDERQHDVEVFGNGIGHSGYIEYFYNNFITLPQFDVREVWQFYHPPLHHIIAAVFMRILTTFGMDYAVAIESLQMLSLLYSALTMLVSHKLLKYLKLNGTALCVAFAVVAFHPTFIVFSGSINNDPLSVLFMLSALYYAIRWYKDTTVLNIVKIALCIGLGMLTKLSAWMVAVPVAILFLFAFITKNNNICIKKYLLQFIIFAIICVPLGMFWSIRNYVLYQVPITYIPMLSYDNPQFVGYITPLKRLFDFSLYQFKSVFDMWGDPYFEFNPTVGLLKTAMFGEWISATDYPSISIVGTVLFWLGTSLCLVSAVAFFSYIIKNIRKNPITLSLLSFFVTVLVMYYFFCISYPFTCTQNIRYAVPLITLGAIGLGFAYQNGSKLIKATTMTLTVLFSLFSVTTYFLIGV